eukprot:COSAG05_NODE_793_length_7295_cov_2.666481_6_plen_181_part_00
MYLHGFRVKLGVCAAGVGSTGHSWLRQPLPFSSSPSSSIDTTGESGASNTEASTSDAAALNYSVVGAELLARLEAVVAGLRARLANPDSSTGISGTSSSTSETQPTPLQSAHASLSSEARISRSSSAVVAEEAGASGSNASQTPDSDGAAMTVAIAGGTLVGISRVAAAATVPSSLPPLE